MEMKDEIRIRASKAQVYAALNDPNILKASIPGCETLEQTSDDELEAKVVLKVGPVKATFGGKVRLDRSGAPDSFSLVGEGSGGVAGFAKGGADVELVDDGDETVLRYAAKAEIGGKIAMLGSRLINSTAQKLAEQFFTNFSAQLNGEAPGQAATG